MSTRDASLRREALPRRPARAGGGARARRASRAAGTRPGRSTRSSITGSAVVRLVQGGEDSVFVEGDEEAQKAARLEVEGGMLSIRPAGCVEVLAQQATA